MTARAAPRLIETLNSEALIADKAYDNAAIVEQIEQQGSNAVISSRRNSKTPRPYDKTLYKERNGVERFFNRLKHYRGLATRYEKTSESFMALLYLVCAKMWLV